MSDRVLRAYCYASGLIEFGRRIPAGAIVIARGPEKQLRDFIDGKARHGYRSRYVGGRLTKVPGTEHLLVPGIPEAPNQLVAEKKLREWTAWISAHAPKGVRVLPS